MRRAILAGLITVLGTAVARAHGVAEGDQAFLASAEGLQLWPYFYLGAKHMVTGYDHLLFLLGVVFLLFRARDVLVYVSLFTLGHSLTLLTGVLLKIHVSPYLVDSIIGLSVCYKALDNLGYLRGPVGRLVDPRLAVFGFGLIHGFGLSTKLQDIALSEEGLIPNMLAFNLGVEAGQFGALLLIFTLILMWRQRATFFVEARAANWVLFTLGLILFLYQAAGLLWGS